MAPNASAMEPAPAPYTVALYYKYVRIAASDADVAAFVSAQEQLCQRLQLTGRVRIAIEGINGTLGGTAEHIDQYISEMTQDPRFADVDWKTSASNVAPFPELLVRHAPEIVTLELPDAQCDPTRGGTHLTPHEFHDAQLKGPSAAIAVIDVRNTYEYNIGHFDGAVTPQTRRFSQFPAWVRRELPTLQQKEKILLYCTGGIRCEKASAYLRHLGLENVYQLQGGIHRYLEQFPDGGKFQGKNFVFDQRVAMTAEAADSITGQCSRCATPYDTVSGLRCFYCRTHVMLCDACRGEEQPVDQDEPFVFCEAHAHLAEGSVDELTKLAEQLQDALANETGHGRKGKRRSLRKQLDVVDRARIRATIE